MYDLIFVTKIIGKSGNTIFVTLVLVLQKRGFVLATAIFFTMAIQYQIK
jgi:hypothetical protein